MDSALLLNRVPTPSKYVDPPSPPCLLFTLPLEIRKEIFRYIAISRLNCRSHPRLWRPLGVDGGIHRIGYFERDSVIPLLLTSHKVHDEVAAVLYGENTFAFHISGLAEGPIWFLEWLAPQYIRLLRKVYIRTGYHVDTYGFRPYYPPFDYGLVRSNAETAQIRAARNIAISVALMRQAWPKKYHVIINERTSVAYPADEVENFLSMNGADDWPAVSYHLWKMFVTDPNASLPRLEFKRIEWGAACVKNLRPDGTRETIP